MGWPPVACLNQAGLHDLQAREVAHDLLAAVLVHLGGGAVGRYPVPGKVGGIVVVADAQDEVASGRHAVPERRHDVRCLRGLEEVQNRRQDHAKRLARVDQRRQLRAGQDVPRAAHVPRHGGHPARIGEQRGGMRDHHRVVVHVRHAGIRAGQPRDLMRWSAGRHAGAHVDELHDPLPGHVVNRASLELPALPRQDRRQRQDLLKLRRRLPVHPKVVLPAQGIVVQARGCRPPGIERHQRTISHKRNMLAISTQHPLVPQRPMTERRQVNSALCS